MKLKLVVIDLELSKRAKRFAAAALVPVLVLAGGAIAYASVPHTWKDGDTLTAGDLNADFADLDARVTSLQTTLPRVTEWTTYTPVLTAGAQGPAIPIDVDNASASTGYWRRVGDSLEVRVSARAPTCSTLAGALSWSLPSGLAIDTAKVPYYTTVGSSMVGYSGQITNPTVINTAAPSAVSLQTQTDGHALSCADVGNEVWFRFQFSVPVQGWSVAD